MTEDRRQEEKIAVARRKQACRAQQTEEQIAEERINAANRMQAIRAQMTEEQRTEERLRDSRRKQTDRLQQTDQQREEERLRDSRRKQMDREQQTNQQRTVERINAARRMQVGRAHQNTRVKLNEALNSPEIMEGTYRVPDLEDTVDKIGKMEITCPHCQAKKFKGETGSMCCGQGKVNLDPFPKPPAAINELFKGNTPESKLFRENARSINGAVCLTSMKAKEQQMQSGFQPSVIIGGRIQHMMGPLEADDGTSPKFAQLYIKDPQLENSQRFESMSLPAGMSTSNKQRMKEVLRKVQDDLHRVNPYVKDFLQVKELQADEMPQGSIVISAKNRPAGEHTRRYNEQLNLNEVSILTNIEPHDLVIQKRSGGVQSVSSLNPKGMPLHFTLLFPHGTYGWDQFQKHVDGRRRVTPREWYTFHLNIRDIDMGNYVHLACRLFQEWICMAWFLVEDQRLAYQRQNQKALRADTYKNIRDITDERRRDLAPREDGMFHDDHQQPAIGRKILSSSFTGSPRFYNAKFQDGMAIIGEYHKPDFFITMTCNPNWPEIQEALLPGQKPQDRPDVVTRVFNLKKKQLMDDLTKGGVLGEVEAHMETTEWQKRGMPHEHILIILKRRGIPLTPELVDRIISAELPPSPEDTNDPTIAAERQRLNDIVLKNMIHGPCSADKCLENGNCTKKFPKEFNPHTIVDPDNFYATYRRRSPEDGGRQVVCPRSGRVLDNRWVVPYSPYLSLRYNCHINVEICASPKAAKYLHKYINKGNDRAAVGVEIEGQARDEIAEYEDRRSVGSCEAAWHLFGLPFTDRFPPVQALRVHLADQQQVVFDEGTEEEAMERQKETELTAFFKFNREMVMEKNKDPAELPTYVKMPKKHRYDKKTKTWQQRKRESDDKVIGRVHTVHPLAGETFYLRILLHNPHCKGKVSYEDMLTLPDGRVCETFQQVCCELGLLQDDQEWKRILEESAATKMCPQIRELFVIILMFCQPSSPRALYDEFWTTWTDDFAHKARQQGVQADESQLETMLQLDLEMRLQSFEKTLAEFGLPHPTEEDLSRIQHITNTEPVIIREEKEFNVEELITEVQSLKDKFTEEQSAIFNTVLDAVKNEAPMNLFIDARGGCGKTFLINGILAAVRSLEPQGCVALAMATTGIAANLLDLGRTYHSRMKAPLTPDDKSTLNISAQSGLAQLIQMTRLLLIDEVTMLDRFQLEAMDRTLQDLLKKPGIPFGGKVVVLAGDFRQCLPVIPAASRPAIVKQCINKSRLWHHFKIMNLTRNMRVLASGDATLEAFDKWTLTIGNGEVGDELLIPEEMHHKIEANTLQESWHESQSMSNFCKEVFPNLQVNINSMDWLKGRAILAPTNKEVDGINDMMKEWIPGDAVNLSSADSVGNPNDAFRYNTEYLNTLKPNGFPQHMLQLKPGMPLMLLRNLNPRQGLCNGTRLIFETMVQSRLLQCRIVGSNRIVLIPRITFIPKVGEYPFEWERRQYPVRPAFAITINKSQGQTMKEIGVWLRGQVFTHGQLYVACSRVGKPDSLRFAVKSRQGTQERTVTNVVYKEVLLRK